MGAEYYVVLSRILQADFYEKALFVKPTWRLVSVVNATADLCPSRYASIRTLGEPTSSRWLGAFDEIRLLGLIEGAAIF